MKSPPWHLNPRIEPASEPAPPKVPSQPRSRFDSARTGSENREHWRHADALSPNAAANALDRKILRERARYEVANNSFAYGAANSLSDDCIGTGPRLQLILPDSAEEKVRQVEDLWQAWCDEVRLGDTLRLMYRAQCVDGEAIAIITDNQRLNHPVKLYLREFECDRLTDPSGYALTTVNLSPGRVDGIHFDSAGNPIRYTVLRQHPGDMLTVSLGEWDEYPASQVYHLFRADRPGQARGVSWLTPALPLFAQLRRYTLAVLSAAETAANIAGVLHTNAPADPDGAAPTIETMDQVPIPRNALLTLPNEWQATSFQGDQPQQTFGDFRTQILVEIGRALDMPLNRITGNSSGYNYSSGRLDHLGYQRGVWMQRDKLRLVILDRLFRAWYDEALLAGAIPAGLPPMSEWAWDWQWDAFGDIDPSKEAKAAGQLLELNLTTHAEQCAARGLRWDQVFRQKARELALAKELGLPMATDQPPSPEAPNTGQTLEEMAAAAKVQQGPVAVFNFNQLAPLSCGGEGGTPGPCPGGGDGSDKHAETHDKWEREDVDRQAVSDKKVAEVEKQRDAATEKLQGQHEREDQKVEDAREREKAGVEKEREKEDNALEKARYKEDKVIEKALDKEDEKIEKARDKENDAIDKARENADGEREVRQQDEDDKRDDKNEAEDEATAERREKEPEKEPGQWDREDKETADSRAKEAKEIEAARQVEHQKIQEVRDKEDKEQSDRRGKEDDASLADRAKEDEALGSKRDAEDKAISDARNKEDASREADQKREDAKRESRQGEEIARLDAEHDARIAELEQQHEEAQRAVDEQRQKDNPDASKEYYPLPEKAKNQYAKEVAYAR